MPQFHFAAPAVRRVAEALIAEHHKALAGVRMEYLFQSEASHRGGRITFGTARKITGYHALLSSPDVVDDPDGTSEGLEYFLITIAHDMWLLMPERARIALVDHELSHCRVDEADEDKLILSIRSHDLEEFSSVLRRHGLWRVDIEDFMRSVGSDLLSLWSELPPPLDDEEIYEMMHQDQRTPPPGVSADGEVRNSAETAGE